MFRTAIFSIFLTISPFSIAQKEIISSYQQQQAWQDLQQQFPVEYRLNQTNLPSEYYWNWQNYRIHVDHYPRPESQAKVILLHGVGTNGRQMSLVLGQPLAKYGYETFALDLPGYGLTQYDDKSSITYPQWVDLVNDFVNDQAKKDNRPIFLYGLSAGGMLTLHTAMQNANIKGVIGMTFLDQQQLNVKKGTMRFSWLSPVTLPSMKIAAHTPIKNVKFPMSLVSKMSKLTNDPIALKIMLNDKTSAGNSMSLNFLNSYMNYQAQQNLDQFSQCPVLLTQPEKDQWTPLELSNPVMHKLKVPYQIEILPTGGHFPVEKPALDRLQKKSIEFIQQNI